jgi:cytochrome c1
MSARYGEERFWPKPPALVCEKCNGTERIPIPCPDRKSGCAVAHYGPCSCPPPSPGRGERMSCHDHGNCELCDQIEADLAALQGRYDHIYELNRSTLEQFAALKALLREGKSSHHDCEDYWYSCPKAKDGYGDASQGDKCICGADEWNAKIEEAIR